jgi:hypothetical protein
MKRSGRFLPALALASAVAVSALLAGRLPDSSAQLPAETNRKPACGCFVCAPPGWINTVEFGEKDCAGTLAQDACPAYVAKLPAEKRAVACQKIREKFDKPLKDSCPAFASVCEPGAAESKPDCEKPSPWLQPSADCKDVQETLIAVEQGAVKISMCGHVVFRTSYEDFKSSYEAWGHEAPPVEVAYRPLVPPKVCCDKFREAARTGVPCDPRADVDCDGQPNQSGGPRAFPDINGRGFAPPDEFAADAFPPGLTEDEIAPPAGKCDCKWKLLKGELSCSPDGKQRHSYQARWLCPSTKNEVFTRKEAAPTAPCKKERWR